MYVLTTVLVGLVCLAAGFVGGKIFTEKSLSQADLQKQIDESEQQMNKYREDVSSNLAVTQKLMADMKTNYDSIVEQMATTTKLLEQPRVSEPQIPYFGLDATEQLLATSGRREESKRRTESIESQPSDYSDGSSGLFNNTESQKQTETEQA
ncbi:MAG: DUF1043 family protein [Algicola sp.]|nr:DUF1043 family protein [Algicola sp.]